MTSPAGRHSPGEGAPFAEGMCWQGRFELLHALGMGTSGAVFEARDRVTGRQLALKILRRCEPQALARFKQEFRVLSQIAHPNLVAVHELIVDADQRACFSMDLVRGHSFLEYVRGGSGCDEARLRSALTQLVRGVSCLHEHGVLHRDLKPANVLIDASGRLSLVDFGLAQHRDQVSGPAQFEGTPAYAAPEQLASAAFSCESDWYGVGVMLYEALTGHRPALGAVPPLTAAELDEQPIAQDLLQVCRALLAHDPALRPNGAQLLAMLGAARPGTPPLTAAEVGAAVQVVGRDAELARLRTAFAAVGERRGAISALALYGPSGIGKTSLAQALLAELRNEPACLVLHSRCFVHESVHYNAFDGIIDGLAAHLQALPARELSGLAPRGLGALVQLFPALRACFGPCPVVAGDEQLRATAFAALRQLLLRLAARGRVVMFIDDLQWADTDSAQLLSVLVSSELRSLFILATWRSDIQPGPPLSAALAHFEPLQLGPLPADAAAALVCAEVAECDSALAHEIVARASGHPLHVWELIREAREQGPSSALDVSALDHALVRRSQRLSASARALLELVCVAGRPLSSAVLLASQDAGEQAALRELRAARLTRDSRLDGELSYVEVQHDRVRSALLSQLPQTRARALHALLAERLLACGDAGLEHAVQHMLLAGRHEQAGLLAERAAEGASARLAFHSAADLLVLALTHVEPGAAAARRLQLKAAHACARAGRLRQAGDLFEQAARSAQPAAERVELLWAAMSAYGSSGHGGRARELLNALCSELSLPFSDAPLSVVIGMAWLRSVAYLGLPRLRARAPAKPARRGEVVPPAAALRLLWRSTPSVLVIDPELSCQFAARSLPMAARQGDASIYAQALAFHMTALYMFTGKESRAAERTFARAQRLAALYGDEWDQAFVRVMRGAAAAHLWQHARAAALVEDVAAARELSTPYAASVRALARSVYLASLFQSGGLDQGAELAEEYVRSAIACGDRQAEFGCRLVGSHVYLRRDDVQQAQAELSAAYALDLDYWHVALGDPHWELDVSLYAGDARAALRRYEQQRAQAGREVDAAHSAQLRFVAVEARCLLACVAEQGMTSELWRALKRCLQRLQGSASAAAQPMAAQVIGTLALRSGLRSQGVSQLMAAARGLDALGMPLYAASLRLGAARSMPRDGAAAERGALVVLSQAGIAAPLRWANMLAPALGLLDQPA